MKKLIVVTGFESSGSAYLARITSYVTGKCLNFSDWSGYSINGNLSDRLVLIHRSMPYTRPRKWLCDLKEEIRPFEKDYDIFYIICTRDLNISTLSRMYRFGGRSKDYKDDNKLAASIFRDLVLNESRVYIFNYESAIALKECYFMCFYDFLESNGFPVRRDFIPVYYDGNRNYIKSNNLKIFFRRIYSRLLSSRLNILNKKAPQ